MMQLTTYPNDNTAVEIHACVNALKILTDTNPSTGMTSAINALPIEQLRKLQDGFGSNREDVADIEV